MRVSRAPLLAVLGVFAGCSAEPTVGVLRVCLGENDPPRSQAMPVQGFDVDVARILASGLSRELQPVWLAEANPTEIESTDIDYGSLLNGRCDVQLSIPGDDGLGVFAGRLVLSQPYYGAGFELVPETASLDLDAPRGERIAVRSNTVAHLLIDRLGFDWTQRRDSADIEAAIDNGEAAAGLVWGLELATMQISYNEAFEPPPALRWNHHAVTRAADLELRDAINEVLARGDVRDDIESLMRLYRIPPHRPFASVHQTGASEGR